MASEVTGSVRRFWAGLKSPWAFTVTLITIAFTCFVLVDERAFGTVTAFKFAAVIVGALGTSMVIALAIRAFMTMMLMLCGMLAIATCAALSLDAEAFKDAAFEGMMLMIAGSIAILLKGLLERHQPAAE